MKKLRILITQVFGYGYKKYLLIMKITTLLCLISLLPISASIYSQNHSLTLKANNKTIKEVLEQIEQESKFHFLYNDNYVDLDKKVDLEVNKMDIHDILDQLLKGSSSSYKVLDNNLVVIAPVEIMQQQKVTGKVVDATSGEPLIGVNVIIEGTTTGTITGTNGEFSIDVPNSSSVLLFSFIGYNAERFVLNGQTNLEIKLIPDIQKLEEVVVVGYGTQRKGELSVSVSQIKSDQIQSVPKTSVMETLGGRAAGVDVVTSSGAPGSSSTIRIRGANSILSSADPLYVIDGFPVAVNNTDMNETSRLGVSGDQTDVLSLINPNDIESIEILKDAAATSIYGARGSNGVILITTKRGKMGKSDISLSVNTGIQKVAKQWEMMNATEFSELLYDAYKRGGVNMDNLGYDPAKKLAIPVDYNTNWVDEITQTGIIEDYNLSFTGASENTNYSGSVGYYNNDGIITRNNYKRYSALFNADAKAWGGKIKFGLTGNLSYSDQKNISTAGVYNAALRMAPNYPVYFPEGTEFAGFYTHSDSKPAYEVLWGNNYGVASSTALTLASPFYQTHVAKTPVNQTWAMLNSYISLEIIKGLTLKTSAGTNTNFNKSKFLIQSYGPYRPTGGSVEHKQEQNFTWMLQNTLNFQQTYGRHSITALIGQEAQKYHAEGLSFAAEEATPGKNYTGNNPFYVDGWWFNNGVNDHLTDSHKQATVGDWAVASYFGRFTYTYSDRYSMTATLRKDGSSKFGNDSKWGTFPGIAVLWNLHNESFFKVPFINQLKLRGSWGEVGNGNIGSYQSQALLASAPSSLIGAIIAGTRTWESGLVDPGLEWESSRMTNLAFDATLFNRLNITAETFWKKTYNLLYVSDLPHSTGFSSISVTNLGSMQQYGFELMFSGDIIRAKEGSGFNWFASLNIDHMQGKVTELPSNKKYVGDQIRSYLDEPIGEIYGYKVDGIYNTPEEISDLANPYKNASLGDYRYHDYGSTDAKGNFVMVRDTNITAADRVKLGNVNPKISFGFNNNFSYKNVDLSLFFRGSLGNKIFNGAKRAFLDTRGTTNTIKEAVNRWTPENHSQEIQAANSNRKDPTGTYPLSIFVEDGSYLRLSNLTLGYTFSRKILERIRLQNLRIYSSINNVFVLTKYSGLDPEIGGGDILVPRGIDQSSYPKTRIYSLGLQLKF